MRGVKWPAAGLASLLPATAAKTSTVLVEGKTNDHTELPPVLVECSAVLAEPVYLRAGTLQQYPAIAQPMETGRQQARRFRQFPCLDEMELAAIGDWRNGRLIMRLQSELVGVEYG